MKWNAKDYTELINDALFMNNEWMSSKLILRQYPEIKNDRNVREIINILRQDGSPIISSSIGYKYSEDIDEVISYNETLKHRIKEMVKAYKGLNDFIEKNQQEIIYFERDE